MIEIGMTHTVEKTVTADMTAKAVGSGGLEVLGTPYMMGLMECAAMWCVQNSCRRARVPWAWTSHPAIWHPPLSV